LYQHVLLKNIISISLQYHDILALLVLCLFQTYFVEIFSILLYCFVLLKVLIFLQNIKHENVKK